MKKILSILIIFLLSILFNGCYSYKKSYSQKRGLMMLDRTEQPTNSRFNSSDEIKKKRKTYKKYKKRNKNRRKNRR